MNDNKFLWIDIGKETSSKAKRDFFNVLVTTKKIHYQEKSYWRTKELPSPPSLDPSFRTDMKLSNSLEDKVASAVHGNHFSSPMQRTVKISNLKHLINL